MRPLVRRSIPFVASALVLAACGGPAGVAGDAFQVLSAAADATKGAGSSRVSMTADFASGGQSGRLEAEGTFDYTTNRGSLDMRFEDTASGQEVSVRFVLDGTVFYMKLPAEAGLPGGKPWVRVDLTEAEGMAFLGELSQTSPSNPAQILDHLRGVSRSIQEVGRETVRDVDTVHYRATVDLERAADRLSEKGRDSYLEAIKPLETTTLPMDVWVDEDGLVRRMGFSFEVSEGGQSVTMTLRMDLYEFGIDVDVSAPPASEVTELSELLERSPGG
jgi:hypothetical protein